MSKVRYCGCLTCAGIAGVFLDLHHDGSALIMALVCLVYAIDTLVDAVKSEDAA